MNDELTIRSGIRDVMPTVFGYITVGMAYGIVAKTGHLSLLMIGLMSLIVYAGSAQFVLVSMLATGSPIGAMVISTALINARMSLMSMTVAPYLKDESMTQNVLIGTLLTDESFALSMNKLNYTGHRLNAPWFHTVNVGAYLVWFIASLLGAVIGGLIPNPDNFGLDFAVVAMFIGLLYLQMITDRSKPFLRHLSVAGVVAVAMVVLVRYLPGTTAIIIATVIGCLFGMGVERHAES
ncbi:AzlC family ABC transporter permease [Lacticaseibacillus rhamnosus]|uniref:AzlC family ABC transporter permease n=1 Tax=Lacticaseibacillus rhamnosus TaxID=47715 RepID=UPI00194DEBA4|nr:AzlC family ABC transporter permease [Lacticaseibacillus rhamnosus]MBM6441549.1 AzlC family ABC transporter permease [Lacticaseibacillus rhamnosus]